MAPQTLGKYVITRTIARGGMAEVCLAQDPTLGREVAIKIIFPHLAADPDLVQRFHREARLVASLRHRHIIQIYDYDVIDDQPFMVMEYLAGGTLKDRLDAVAARGTTLPLHEIPRLLDPIAAAIDYAHERGAIHRDIKPANILFTVSGEPVVTDFGVARILGQDATRTLAGAIVGSPAYMSPEQAAGKPVDARSDLYSLGVILYQMATGRVPFMADSPTGVMLRHVTEPTPPPRTFNPDIPEDLQWVVFRAMAKHPDRRFASAGEMARAVRLSLRPKSPMSVEELKHLLLQASHDRQVEPPAEPISQSPPVPPPEAGAPDAQAQPPTDAPSADTAERPLTEEKRRFRSAPTQLIRVFGAETGAPEPTPAPSAFRSQPTERVGIGGSALPSGEHQAAKIPAAPRGPDARPPVSAERRARRLNLLYPIMGGLVIVAVLVALAFLLLS